MAQETKTQVKDQNTPHDHIDDDEVSELQRPPSFYQKVRELAERFACTRFGQFTIERADRGLKLIEDTTKWSLPQEKNPSVVLERTLPWVPFLLLIIMLRLTRIWLSVGALMIGNGPVSPTDVIYFIQTRRRKLRAIRVHGLKVMRHRHQETSSSGRKSFTQQLSVWLSRAICRPGVQRANSGRLYKVEQPQNQTVAKRPREEDTQAEPEHNLTIDELLNKFANENSEDDSDFVPNPEDETETGSSESESNSSDEVSTHSEEEMAEKHKSSNGVVHNKTETRLVEAEERDQEKSAKTTTSNGSNGDKQQTEVAQQLDAVQQDDWMSTPQPSRADMLKIPLYNNAAAAANTDPNQFQTVPNQSTSYPEPKNDPKTAPDTESDSDPESTPNPQLHSTVETLTPATSSEDIFYSPIGSPNCFNSCFEHVTPLNNVTIQKVATHSTPNSELEFQNSPTSQLVEAANLSISLAQHGMFLDTPPQQPQQTQLPQPQQQQQRYRQHNSRPYRGRNRR